MDKKNKENILVVTTSFPRWKDDSSPRFIFDLSKRLVDSFNVIILTPHYPGAKVKENWSGLSIYRFRYFWPISWQKICYYGAGILPNLKNNKFLIFTLPFLFIVQFFKIIYLVKKENIDLIHAHCFFPSGFIAGLVGKIYKIPTIVTVHGSDIFALKGIIWKKMKKIVMGLASAITVSGSKVLKTLIEIKSSDKNKIFVIPMGIDASLFSFQNNFKKKDKKIDKITSPILLFVGMLSEVKGLKYLIKAMPLIIKKFPRANLIIIGFGHEKKKLESLVVDLKLKNNVIFLGDLPNKELPYYYSKADIFILPSLSEGMGVSLLEAMSVGCPAIATKVGGVPDVINNNKNGLLIEPYLPEAIDQAVDKILSDDDLKDIIIKEARKTIEKKYNWQIIANRFKDIYKIYLSKND